jgi:hypothetical protein
MASAVRIGIDWARTIDVTIDGHTCVCGTPLAEAWHPDRRVLLEHTDPTGRPCPLDEDELVTAVYRIAATAGLITAGAGTPREQACALR